MTTVTPGPAEIFSTIHRNIRSGSAYVVRLYLFYFERERICRQGRWWVYDDKAMSLSTLRLILWKKFYNVIVRYKYDKYPDIPSRLYSNLTSKKLFSPIVSKFLKYLVRVNHL